MTVVVAGFLVHCWQPCQSFTVLVLSHAVTVQAQHFLQEVTVDRVTPVRLQTSEARRYLVQVPVLLHSFPNLSELLFILACQFISLTKLLPPVGSCNVIVNVSHNAVGSNEGFPCVTLTPVAEHFGEKSLLLNLLVKAELEV